MKERRSCFKLKVIVLLIAVNLLSAASSASAQSAPEGWGAARAAGGIVVYTPPDLSPGEVYSVAVFPHGSLSGKSLEGWLVGAIAGDPAPPGKATGPPQVKSQTANVVVAARLFAGPGGRQVAGIYTGVSLDGRSTAMMRVAWSGALYDKYKDATLPMVRALAASLRAGGGAAPAAPPGKAQAGGKIVEGIYAGDQVCKGGDGQELWRNHYRLHLYADGEYRLCDGNDKDLENNSPGRYQYDPATGRLEVNRFLNMYNNADEGAVCVYGRDGAGKPLVAAKEGIYDTTTELHYAGPVTRLAPDTEAQAKVGRRGRGPPLQVGHAAGPWRPKRPDRVCRSLLQCPGLLWRQRPRHPHHGRDRPAAERRHDLPGPAGRAGPA